jgi:hypothetical protein
VLYDRDPSTGALSEVSTSVFSAGTEGNGDDVSYMNDKKGLHAIINPSANEVIEEGMQHQGSYGGQGR